MNTEKPKRARRLRPAFGRCPDCTSVLQMWRLAPSRNLLELADEIGCAMCQEVKFHLHREACQCSDCRAGIPKMQRIQT